MPLSKREVTGVFQRGLDSGGSDPKVVSDSFLRAENVIFPRRGSLAKRHGTAAITAAASQTFLSSYRDTPLLYSHSGAVYSFNQTNSSGTTGTVNTDLEDGDIEIVDVKAEPVVSIGGTFFIQTDMDIDGAGDVYGIIRKAENGSTNFITINVHTGQIIDKVTAGSSADPDHKVVTTADGTIIFLDFSTGLKWRTVDSAGTISAESTLTALTRTYGKGLDAVKLATDKIAFTYLEDTSDNPQFVIWDSGANTYDAEAEDSGVTAIHTSLYYVDGSDTGWVYCSTTTLYADLRDNTGSSSAAHNTGSGNIKQVTGVYVSSYGGGSTKYHQVLANVKASNTQPEVRYYTWDTSSGLTFEANIDQVTFTAKPFVNEGNTFAYINTYHQGAGWWKTSPPGLDRDTPQRAYFIFKLDSETSNQEFVLVAKSLWGRAGHSFDGYPAPTNSYLDVAHISNIASIGSGKYAIPAFRMIARDTIGLERITVDLSPDDIRAVEGSDRLLIPSSIGSQYEDGDFNAEMGFVVYPEGLTVAEVGTSGTWSGTGKVGFVAIYEYTDCRGRKIQSIPSPLVSHTLSATNVGLDVTIPACGVTVASNVDIVLYRTDVDGSILYRQQKIDNPSLGSRTTVTSTTDNGGDTLFLSVTNQDGTETVSVSEVLYTQNNSLPIAPPPPHLVSTVWQNRYFCADRESEDERVVFSREFFDGRGIPFSDLLEIKVDQSGGRITALEPLGEKLTIFKEDRIYITTGRGPDDTGSGSTYTRPRLVSTGVGCVDQKSITQIPQGVCFKSKDGIYLLTYGEQLQFIGQGVRYYTDTYSISSANTVPQMHYAIWTTSDGPSLVFDYILEQWSTFTGTYDSAVDAVVSNGILYTYKSTTMSAEDRSSYLDNTTAYSMLIETGWFQFNNLIGYQRLYESLLVGQNITNHKIRVKVSYDLEPYWKDSLLLDDSAAVHWDYTSHLDGSSASNREGESYKVKIKGSRQKCDAIRYQISDEAPDGGDNEQAMTVTGLRFLVGLKPNMTRIESGREVA